MYHSFYILSSPNVFNIDYNKKLFLKDNVTLKTEVMAAENASLLLQE